MMSCLVDPVDPFVSIVDRPEVMFTSDLMVKQRLDLISAVFPQHAFVLAEAEKTHRGAMASHGIFLVCLSHFSLTLDAAEPPL